MSDAPEGGTESTGGGLRAQLEAALADKKALQQAHIETLIGQYGHVRAEDFAGISASQYASHAAQVEQQRIAERDSLLREALVAKGIADGDLDSVISQLKAPAEPPASSTPASRTASLGGLAGAPATFEGKPPETSREWILAGLRQAEKNKK
jgi:hypothetical protein